MTTREDVEFSVGDCTIGAWLFRPEKPSGAAITMAHGFAGTKEHGLQRFAHAFAKAGFAVLVHDHRNFGRSGGDVRGDVDPWQQVADWRGAISYLETRAEVDPRRIGLWGTSFAGGHALVLGATDQRLKAVVTHVPSVEGFAQGLRMAPQLRQLLEEALNEDERARLGGAVPGYQTIVSSDPAEPAVFHDAAAVDFYLQPIPEDTWRNEVTLRSLRLARMYEPGTWAARVSPTPLLFIVADHDIHAPADLALHAYEEALQPKGLKVIHGGHFDPYLARFAESSGAAIEWFREHL